MNSGCEINATELFSLLCRQRDAYRRLRLLADRQRSLVMLEDSTALLGVLADRQRVVDELTDLQATLAPYRAAWTSIYRGMDAGSQRQARELLGESNALLAAVMASDAQDAETLGARRNATAAALSDVRIGSRAAAAYGSRANRTEECGALSEAHA